MPIIGGLIVPHVRMLGRRATCSCVLIVERIGVSAMIRLTRRGNIVVVTGFIMVMGVLGWIEGL